VQKKRVLILALCLAVLIIAVSGAVTASPSSQANAVTFKTPEDAITHFFEGVAQGDFNKILEACAVNEASEHFQFDLQIDRLGVFAPAVEYAPATNPLYVAINDAQITARIANQVKILTYSLLSTENLTFTSTNMIGIDVAQSFMTEVDPARLSQLEVKEIALPNPTAMKSARYQAYVADIARVYGADELTERVVLFSFEQKDYILGFTLLRYGDDWKISSANSAIANTDSSGGVAPTTVEDFESMIH
jgi:hypothetical protein